MGGLFWRLEATSNDLDPDFNRSSLRLSQFFCPNLCDLQKKKKKRSSARLSLSGRNHIRSLTTSYRQYHWGGGYSVFWAKIGLKNAKNGVFCILFRPMGGYSPLLATPLGMLEAKDTGASVSKNIFKIFKEISKKKFFKNFFQAISKKRTQKRSSRIFREVFGVFQHNVNGSKNITAFLRT